MTVLSGRWRVSEYGIFCGTLRICTFDFDTDPSDELKAGVYQQMEAALNSVPVAESCHNRLELTEQELKVCPKLPDVLRALAEHHSAQETMAEPMGYVEAAAYHRARRKELGKEAERIESEW